jgi:hypothetical protein
MVDVIRVVPRHSAGAPSALAADAPSLPGTLEAGAESADLCVSGRRCRGPPRFQIAMPRRATPHDLARRLAAAGARRRASDGFRRDTFALPREAAREKARELFARYPKAAYMTEIESWRELPGDEIEFTMRRLPTAD